MDLSYYMPTKLLMGENVVEKNKSIFSIYGKSALIVTGKNSAKSSGALDDVINALNSYKISYTVFDKIMPNPTVDVVYLGASVAKENNCDFVIAIGGGSPMDAAKAISALTKNNVSKEDVFNSSKYHDIMPMIFIPTTAGTGSEVTQYSILTDDKNETKTSIASTLFFPNVALLDAKYMKNLGRATTINTAIDALCHAIESYLSKRNTLVSEIFSLEAIRLIAKEFNNLKKYDLDYNSRSNLLYASSLAGIAIAHTSTVVVHVMGYPLTYYRDVDHGRANGLVLLQYLYKVNESYPDKINKLLEALNLTSLKEFDDVISSLLGEKENVSLDEIKKFASNSMKKKNVSNSIVELTENDLIDMYSNVFLK